VRLAELPLPDPAALRASRELRERIGAELRAHSNWISFARYMEIALHEPGLGYYSGGAAKLGRGGDFVTAPELSPLFGRTLARQLRQLLAPGEAVLELGAGSGALAQTLVEELACPYWILETSAELRDRQRRRLGERARWIERLPREFRGVMIANEVLDAIPAHAVAWRASGIAERGVCKNEAELAWAERPARGELLAAASAIEVPAPYESEIGLAAAAWVRALGASLARGAILLIDYGFPRREYYHPQRAMGTLMCHYRHHAHGDPFWLPGLQDITVHVDFSAMRDAGELAGLDTLGFASQAQFLVNCGITEVLGAEDPSQTRRYAPLAASSNLLPSPAEMGELHKVLALGRGVAQPLLGFASGERSHVL